MEHLFRLAKGEVGLGHFEGRSYVGLMRHMILCQLIVLFLAEPRPPSVGKVTQHPKRDAVWHPAEGFLQSKAKSSERARATTQTPPTAHRSRWAAVSLARNSPVEAS